MSGARVICMALLLAFTALATTARADTTCVASAPTTLSFGTLANGAGAATDTTLAITVQCSTTALSALATASVRMCIGLGPGSTGSTLEPTRSMTVTAAPPLGSGDTLSYQLYSNAGRTLAWGLVPGGTPAAAVVDLSYNVALIGGSGTASATVYARIPAGQVLSAGTYSSSYSGANVFLRYAFNERLLLAAPMPASCTSTGGANATGNKTSTGQFPFTVTANVLPSCSAYVTTDMDFGSNAGALASAIDRTSTIGLTCIRRTAYTVGLDNGSNASGTTRRMRHVTATGSLIAYELYRDSARSQRWGNTINVDTVAGTGTGAAQTLTVYGRALPGSGTTLPASGEHRDVVTVTITY